MKYFIFISQYLKMNNNNIPIEKIKFLKEGENNKVDIFPMSQISNDTDFIIKNQKIIEKRCSIKIVVEVDEKEIKNTKFINAKKYKHIEKSKYELIEEKELSLINYALIYDMSVKDLNKGKIVMVDKKNGYYIINTDDNLLYASDFKQQRQYLKMKDSLCDIYFYTEDSDILNKYKEDLTIFERIKEELGNGRSITSAMKIGFSNALRSIMDSNITTLIAGLVLYFFGSGPVKGFALTLLIGIVISMFTAIIMTRFFMNLGFNMGILNKPSMFGRIKGGRHNA